MSGAVVTLLWVQTGSAFWLAFVLQLVYRRVYRELFLHFWSLSFAVMGLALAAQLAVVPPSSPELFTSIPLYLLGIPQFPLVILAALSVEPPAPTRRRQLAVLLGTTAALVILCLATAWAIPEPLTMARAQRAERLALNVGAAIYFCVVFWRKHYLAHTTGGRVTVFFTALRALHYGALIATIAGLRLYPDPHSVISGAMSTVLPFGIAAGMIILAAEAMTETTGRLRESEERYRTLVEASPNAIIATDPSGTIRTCNQRAATIHGYSNAAELVGVSSERLIAPADRDRARLLDASVTGEGLPVRRECQVLRRDGSMPFVELTTAALRGSDGAVAGYVTIVQDISERKEAEAARAQLESQLLQAQKMESIGRLAGGVAHDFNNHLTVIKGYSQLALGRMASTDPNRAALECVLMAGERAATLTRQLLAFGRKQVLSPRPVSLNDVVSGMEGMLGRLVAENIRIATALDSGLGATMADVGQIEQVLMNLVVNARDAMPKGGTILIQTANELVDGLAAETRLELRPGRYVTLAVTDSGVGMNERTRALAFEPFFTTKDTGQGTGLGLAMVYGIVKQSGGSVLVFSEPGKGSTFQVFLPRVDTEARPISTASVLDGCQSGHGTILLVEDQDAVRALICEILRSCGYQVIVASNGSEALALPDSRLGPVDLLVTDVVMPDMSGRDLAARLARRLEGLRVLFISGYAPDTVVHEGVLDPDVHFLQKPFGPAQISSKVAEILSARRGAR
jgi:PAS domain S-box-containing protein